jgi:hypothetical protein
VEINKFAMYLLKANVQHDATDSDSVSTASAASKNDTELLTLDDLDRCANAPTKYHYITTEHQERQAHEAISEDTHT